MMNVILASGGSLWTAIPLKRQIECKHCLETAGVPGEITEFAKFIAELVQFGLDGRPAAILIVYIIVAQTDIKVTVFRKYKSIRPTVL